MFSSMANGGQFPVVRRKLTQHDLLTGSRPRASPHCNCRLLPTLLRETQGRTLPEGMRKEKRKRAKFLVRSGNSRKLPL